MTDDEYIKYASYNETLRGSIPPSRRNLELLISVLKAEIHKKTLEMKLADKREG